MFNKFICSTLLLLSGWNAFGQSNFGEIRGKIVDATNKQPLDYAELVVKKDGITKGGAISDEQGNYYIKALEPGVYSVEAFYQGFNNYKATGIEVNSDRISFWNIQMPKSETGQQLKTFIVKSGKPLVNKDKNQKTLNSNDIKKLPVRGAGGIALTASGVNRSAGGGISFSGQRTDGTAVFIDGVRVIGTSSVTQASQGQIDIIQSGVPAQYGDFTGGAISITTKGPTRSFQKSLEVISSSPFDPYHYNLIEGSMSGPLIIKNKGGGKDEFVRLGYNLAGQLNYRNDPRPVVGGGLYVVKDDVLKNLEDNPLTFNPVGGGFIASSSFLSANDLEQRRATENRDQLTGIAQAKLEYQPNKNTTISLYGSYNHSDFYNFSRSQYLMNYNNFSKAINQTYRTYLKFTQRLNSSSDYKDKKEEKPLITDAFYTIRLDYQHQQERDFNERHGENLFQYGHVGKFTTYRRPSYNYVREATKFIDQNGDTVVRQGFYERQRDDVDTLVTYSASDYNPLRANYNKYLFDNVSSIFNGSFSNIIQIQQLQGILNGRDVPIAYSLWLNPGNGNNSYQKANFERVSAYAIGEASLNFKNRHDIQFGLYYEQSFSSRWAVGASGLWVLMDQLANSHLDNLERTKSNGIVYGGIHRYDQNGMFMDTVDYARRVDKSRQKVFDQRLRDFLISSGAKDIYGRDITESSNIDINALDPSTFSIDMFSADDLWNEGQSYISYFGYDYKGNKTYKRFSIEDFLNDSLMRPQGAFAPIYSAAWIQDKFAFKDLILRVGVRVERFDANQPVLKDAYGLYPMQTASEISSIKGIPITHPDNIGDDFVVYGDNTKNQTRILGYRKDNQWFDANGLEIDNPELIAKETASGQIEPFLVDPENDDIVPQSFKDYEPTLNVLPRIWFSFPINKEAQFFANYDVLAQRPNNIFVPTSTFFFLEQTQGGTINNAAILPRIRTNFELGFKQQLSDNSALSLIAAYAETKNDFGLLRLYGAYPIAYNHTANIDFSTTKQFKVEYELRADEDSRTSMQANYTLLFADGTGSNINSQAALIAANQPNLRSLYPLDVDYRHNITATIDYRFKNGKSYKGPVVGKKGTPILENFGGSFIVRARSGGPYTRNAQATGAALEGVAQRSQILGNPFGSRLPWQFTADMNLAKTFRVKKGNTKDKFHNPYVNVTTYLWVQNLFNQKVINSVYRFTGLPEDDGFLNSEQGQQFIQQQIDQRQQIALVDLYNAKVQNPFNYLTPRQIRLGIRLNF